MRYNISDDRCYLLFIIFIIFIIFSFRYHPIPMIVYEQSIIGSVGATLEDLKEAVKYVAEGKLSTVIDSTIPLSCFQQGLDKIKSCSCVGKIVCVPDEK